MSGRVEREAVDGEITQQHSDKVYMEHNKSEKQYAAIRLTSYESQTYMGNLLAHERSYSTHKEM